MDDNKIKNTILENLLPKENLDIGNYEKYFDEILKNNSKVTNIGVTGPYGSGKTSLIKSYENLHKELKIIYISIGDFKEYQCDINENQETSQEISQKETQEYDNCKMYKNENKIKENMIEGKIINQLVHKLDSKNNHLTKFKRTENMDKKFLILKSLGLTVFIWAILRVFFNNKSFLKIENKASINFTNNFLKFISSEYCLMFAIVTLFIGILYFSYKLIKEKKIGKLLKSLNINGNSVELFNDSVDSLFDIYLDDVLYLFKSSDVNVFVFEDLDRYNSNEVFGRLREINDLLNYNKKDKIKFMYLIRDEMFDSKDRTKFFDIIIPVIPVMDSSNSYDFINNMIKSYDKKIEKSNINENKIGGKLSSEFLLSISLYIDDFRLLQNIMNEFLIYFNELNEIDFDLEKLFSIIVYKNIFPKDFKELQYGHSYLNLILDKIQHIKEEYPTKLREEMEKLLKKKKEIEKCEIELINNNLDEDKLNHYKINGENIRFVENIGENLKQLIKNKELTFKKNDGAIEEKVNYMHLIKFICSEEELEKLDDINIYLDKIEQNKLKKSEFLNDSVGLISSSLKDEDFIIEEELNIRFNYIVNNEYFDLIKYIIRNNYIDSSYEDFISRQYEVKFKTQDKQYMRAVKDLKALPYDFKLFKPTNIIKKGFKPIEFNKKEILNYDILYELLNCSYPEDYLKNFMLTLNKQKEYGFIFSFLKSYIYIYNEETDEFLIDTNKKQIFRKLVNCIFENFKEFLKGDLKYSLDYKNYIALIINEFDLNEIKIFDKNKELTNLISKYDYSGSVFILNNKNTFLEKLNSLGVKFNKLNGALDQNLFSYLYEKDMYNYNWENIETIINIRMSIDFLKTTTKWISILEYKQLESLKKYTYSDNKNINILLKIYFEELEREKITDSQNSIIEVLINENICNELKIKYIKALGVKIHNLNELKFNEEIINKIFNENKFESTLENYLIYYERNISEGEIRFTDKMVENINKNNIIIDKNFVNFLENYKKNDIFFDEILKRNDIENNKYEMILSNMNIVKYNDFNIDNLDSEKILFLINKKIIFFNIGNLENLRKNYKGLVNKFIKENIEDYLENIEDNKKILIEEEYMELLKDSECERYHIEIIKMISSNIDIKDLENEDTILYILENNFDIDNLCYLNKEYCSYSHEVKEKISSLVVENIEFLRSEEVVLNLQLLQKIVLSTDEIIENEYVYETLIDRYDDILSKPIKDKIKNSAIVNLELILNKGKISSSLFKELIKNKEISQEIIIKLILINYDFTTYEKFIEEIGNKRDEVIFENLKKLKNNNKYKECPYSEDIDNLLNKLVESKIIKKYNKHKKNNGDYVFRVYKTKETPDIKN